MDNGQRPGGGQPNPEMLQQALRAFGGAAGSQASPPPLPQEELAALAQRMGLQTPGTGPTPAVDAGQGPQYVLFALERAEIAWPANKVMGVERAGDITPVPFTHQWLL